MWYFKKIDEACAEDVIYALKGEYGNFKSLKRDAVIIAINTMKFWLTI